MQYSMSTMLRRVDLEHLTLHIAAYFIIEQCLYYLQISILNLSIFLCERGHTSIKCTDI